MTKPTIGTGDWIVACDGRKALILENKGDEKFPNLHARETHEHPDLPTHLQGTSRPGVSHQSVGHSRSAVQQTDWHEQAERTFVHDLAKRLDQALSHRETKRLLLIASPRALGVIREFYTPAVRAALVGEIAKDVVKLPISEIESLAFRKGVA